MTVAETSSVPAPPWAPDLYTVEKALRLRTNHVALTQLTPGRDGLLYASACRVFLLPSDIDEALAWVTAHAGPDKTLTWSIATLTPDGAERINSSTTLTGVRETDVAGYSWVAADLDPDDVVTIAEYRRRLAAFGIVPSLVLASGRGLHVFWKLDKWTVASEVVPVLEDLVRVFDSDPGTADLNRNLRLPGTWNPKAEAKRLAVVEKHAPNAAYSLRKLSERACLLSPRPAILHKPRARRPVGGGAADWPDRYKASYDLADELTRITGVTGGARRKWPCPAGHPGDGPPTLGLHRDNPERAVCFGAAHPDGMGKRSGGLVTFDVLDLHAFEVGQTVEQFMADERRTRKEQETPAGTPAAPANVTELTPRQRDGEQEPAPPVGDHGDGGGDQGDQPSEQGQSAPTDQADSDPAEKPTGTGKTAGEKLLRLALDRYTFGQSDKEEHYACSLAQPHIARLLRGNADSLRAELAREYAEIEGKAPSQTALSETMAVLQGEAQLAEPVPLALRLAGDDTRIVLDLGRKDGRCAVITPDGWSLEDEPGVMFRRTKLTNEMPEPVPGGTLERLRDLLNVTPDAWPVLVGWLVASLVPEIDHPIALLTGEQGTGKTTAAAMLVSVLDPTPALTRTAPHNERDWVVSAHNRYVVGIDNLSTIPQWLSDALCQAVTGAGWEARSLYTDGEPNVFSFRRVVVLTSIDAGALRGDLASRLLTVELETIDPTKRRNETALRREWEQARPVVLGGLLDLLAQVLKALPGARERMTSRPRMAGFSEVLKAMDEVLGTNASELYEKAGEQLAADVVLADPVASAVLDLMTRDHGYRGTAAQLLKELQQYAPDPKPKDWPSTSTRLGGALKRATPGLRSMGVEVEYTRTKTERLYTLAWTAAPPPPPGGDQAGTRADGVWS